MNRLTKRTKGGIAYTEIPLNQSTLSDENGNIIECRTGFIADRLAAYEDTGFEPEQVKQLNDAFTNSQKKLEKAFDDLLEYKNLEEQGLLIKLPCKSEPCEYCNSIKISTPASPRRKYKYCPMCGRRRVEE